MEMLRSNWLFKLLSLAGAITVAVYVYKQDLSRTTINLPVGVAPPVGQRAVDPPQGFQVSVDIEGPSPVIRSIENKDARLLFDISNVKPGVRTQVPVAVELSERLRGKGLDVSWRPRSIPVLLVSDTRKTLPVIIKPLNRPDGWQIKDLQVKELNGGAPEVTVSGPAEAVDRVAQVVAPVNLEATEVVNSLVRLVPVDATGSVVTDAEARLLLTPTQVVVSGMQERVVLQKPRVPVQPVFSAPGGMRVSVEVTPRRVRIVGPEREVSDTYVLETTPIQMPAGQAEVIRDVTVVPPKPGITVTPPTVRVTLRNQALFHPPPPSGAGRPAHEPPHH